MYDEDDQFSTAEGFIQVNECAREMIKYVANEPSVGLYYVQQHAHNAIPNLLHLKDRVADRSHETALHIEDLEDSIIMVRSMKDCGLSIADEMVKDIRKSLMVMSRSQPKRGLIGELSSGFQMGKRSSSWGPMAFGQNASLSQQGGESATSYFSTVFNSAKQKTVNIRWPQLDTKQPSDAQLQSPNPPSLAEADADTISTLPSTETEELPLSSQTIDEQLGEAISVDGNSPRHDLSSESQNYEEFKANRVAKLEEWLEEHENLGECRERSELKELNLESTSI